MDHGASNKCTPSTTSKWEWRKIRVPHGPLEAQRPEGAPSKLSRWNRRDPLTITVVYRGGAEAWIQIKARGRTIRVPGHLAVIDALEKVWEA